MPSTACVVLGASGEGPNGRLQSVRKDVLAHYTIEPRAAVALLVLKSAPRSALLLEICSTFTQVLS